MRARLEELPFGRRVVVLTAAAVAVAVAVAAVVVHVVAGQTLRAQVDDSLRDIGRTASAITERRAQRGVPGLPNLAAGDERPLAPRLPADPLGGPTGSLQIITPQGDVLRPPVGGEEGVLLPVDDRTLAVARGERPAYFRDATVDDTRVRILTTAAFDGAIQVARPLTEVEETLGRLRIILLLVVVGGIGGAAGLGVAVSRTALRPVRALTGAAEHVAVTQDLSARMPAGDRDDLERLATSFNTMLAALESSRTAQRQLVSDASHELRTPLTSIRTNVEILARGGDVPSPDRQAAFAAVTEQLEELSVLVGDLVDLARPAGEVLAEPHEPVALAELVAAAVQRARGLAPACRFDLRSSPTTVDGDRRQLHRAIVNLLDNAVKHGPPEGPVEIEVTDATVVVRDHGPGIPEADLPHVFDRFYRAPGARGLPGSGLGLAIVRQAAEAHGGSVHARAAVGGGTELVLRLA